MTDVVMVPLPRIALRRLIALAQKQAGRHRQRATSSNFLPEAGRTNSDARWAETLERCARAFENATRI